MYKTSSATSALSLLLIATTHGQRPAARPPRPASSPAEGWAITTERSEMTDQPSVTLSLAALSAGESPLDTRPSLIVRCRETELELYISTGSVLDADNDITPVRIRWGTAAPEEAYWGRSSDYTAAFAPEPREFLSKLLVNPDLRFEVHPYDASPRVIKFNARGLSRHIEQVNSACPAEQKKKAISDTATLHLDAGGEQVFDEAAVEERPEVLSGPPLAYPDLLREAGVQGRVTVQAIIDRKGLAEPVSVRVIQSPNPGFDQPAKNYVLRAMFRPGRIHGQAVRVLVNVPIDFKIKR